MKIKDIITILNAQLLTPQADLEQEVHTACGSDDGHDLYCICTWKTCR